jgi:hypothetical protein
MSSTGRTCRELFSAHLGRHSQPIPSAVFQGSETGLGCSDIKATGGSQALPSEIFLEATEPS